MSSVLELIRRERQDLYISASALRTLEACPRQWWYNYVLGAPKEDVSARLILGGAVHQALARFYSVLREEGVEPGLDDLTAVASAAIEKAVTSGPPILFGDAKDEEGLVQEADRLLNVFMEHGYRPEYIIGAEIPFSLPLSNPETGELLEYEERVVGAIDLVVEDDNGRIVVIDHKVVSRLDQQRARRADVQMGLYAAAARELFDTYECSLRYQNIVRTKSPKVVIQEIDRGPHDEVEGSEALASGLALIHVAITHPNGKQIMGRRRTWRCRDCSYRRRCAGDRV